MLARLLSHKQELPEIARYTPSWKTPVIQNSHSQLNPLPSIGSRYFSVSSLRLVYSRAAQAFEAHPMRFIFIAACLFNTTPTPHPASRRRSWRGFRS